MYKPYGVLLMLLSIFSFTSAQIQVSSNRKFLTTKDGTPFLWLDNTDWEMFHRLDLKKNPAPGQYELKDDKRI